MRGKVPFDPDIIESDKKQKILLYKNKIFDKMIMHCNVHSTDRYMQTEKEIRQECIEDKDGGKQI